MGKSHRTTIDIPKELWTEFEKAWQGKFTNQSEAIRAALRSFNEGPEDIHKKLDRILVLLEGLVKPQ